MDQYLTPCWPIQQPSCRQGSRVTGPQAPPDQVSQARAQRPVVTVFAHVLRCGFSQLFAVSEISRPSSPPHSQWNNDLSNVSVDRKSLEKETIRHVCPWTGGISGKLFLRFHDNFGFVKLELCVSGSCLQSPGPAPSPDFNIGVYVFVFGVFVPTHLTPQY